MAGRPLAQLVRRLQLLSDGDGEPLSDEELLQLFVHQASDEAFTAIVRRHGPLVLRVCSQLLRDQHDIEDAFQATFLILVRKAASIGRRELLANWLYGVAHRVAARARVQSARRHGQEPLEIADATNVPEPGVREMWSALHEEIERLPTKYRLPVVLCYLEGKTHEEAADALGWPKGTVAGRLARARDLLHRRLVRRGFAVPAAGLAVFMWATSAPAAVPSVLLSATIACAAGTVSRSVSLLTEGVLKAMFLTKLKNVLLVGTACLVLIALSAGAFVAHAFGPEPGPAQPVAQAPPVEQPAPEPQVKAPRPQPRVPRAPVVKPQEPEQPDTKKPDQPKDKGPKERQTIDTGVNGIAILGFTADRKSIILSGGGDIDFVDIESGKRTMRLPWNAFDRHRGHVALSPDGKTMAGASPTQGIKIWDLTTGKDRIAIEWPKATTDPDTGERIGPAPPIAATVSADTKRAASWTSDGKIHVYDTANGKLLTSFAAGTSNGRKLALSPDGKRVAAATVHGPTVWDADTGKELFTLKSQTGHPDLYEEVHFSNDGKLIVAPTHRHVVIWNAQDGKLSKAIEAETGRMARAYSLSPDGKTLAFAPRDKKVQLLDVATGKELATFHWVSWPGNVMFSPDGRSIAATRDGRVRIWDVGTLVGSKE